MNEEIKALIEKEAEKHSATVLPFMRDQSLYTHEMAYSDCVKHGASIALSLFRWRKVEEELPPFQQDVIFKVNVFAKTYHSEIVSIGHIVHDGGYRLQTDLLARDIIEYQIVEWMPIPQ